MKSVTTIFPVLLIVAISGFGFTTTEQLYNTKKKDPIVIEVITKYTAIDEALVATKNVLLKEKFVATSGIQATTFTATRTTASRADYYVADVTATQVEGKIKITISFIKFGTGLLKLQKVADNVKEELEK